jgi:hypothetical protein
VPESARHADEGILHDVLRELTITGDEEREPRHFWGVAKIELLQPSIVRLGLVLHDPVHGVGLSRLSNSDAQALTLIAVVPGLVSSACQRSWLA